MMISAPEEQIKRRAKDWKQQLGAGEVVQGRSTVGGGSLPEETLPTWLLAIEVPHPDTVAGELRVQNPPVIARIERDQLLLDPRTVFLDQELGLLQGVRAALEQTAR
jgi:L-seryl-tRNA(Ser) seleniumtransferase